MSANNPSPENWLVISRHHPSAILLAAPLVSLVLYVALDGVSVGPYIPGVFGMLVLLLVIWVVIHSRLIGLTISRQQDKVK